MKYYLKIILFFIIIALFLSCEKEISVSPKIEKYEFEKIYIDSNPPGASIFLDGKNMGKVTPDTVHWLDYGEQSLTLKLKYFKNYQTNLNVRKNEFKKEFFNFFDLPNVYGNFIIKTNQKNVNVYVNEIYKGISPVSLQNQIPGLYKIKLEKEGFITKLDSLELFSGQSKNELFSLVDTSIYVRYSDLGNNMKYVYAIGTTVNEEVFFFRSLFEGYYKLQNNSMIPFNNEEPFVRGKKIVHEFFINKNGVTKAFTNSGVYNYINNKWEEDIYLNAIVGIRKVNKYIELNNSIIWIGTDDGLILIENGIVKEFNSRNSILKAKSVDDIYVNGDGTTYISTNMTNEVYSYKNGTIKFWNNFDVKKFHKKRENEFFILTNQIKNLAGTDVIKPEELLVFNETGQVSKYNHEHFKLTKWFYINNIKIDPKGNYWVATNFGIIVLDKDFNYQVKYTSTDLNKNDLNVSDILFTKNKEVIIGTFGYGVMRYKQYKEGNWF